MDDESELKIQTDYNEHEITISIWPWNNATYITEYIYSIDEKEYSGFVRSYFPTEPLDILETVITSIRERINGGN